MDILLHGQFVKDKISPLLAVSKTNFFEKKMFFLKCARELCTISLKKQINLNLLHNKNKQSILY